MSTLIEDKNIDATLFTDRELVTRMLARDGLAWREFHRRYDRLIYRCIHKVTGRFTSILGSEDVREVYAMFWVNVTASDMHKLRVFSFERGNKLATWIGMLATHTAWDYLRTCARQPQCAELAEVETIASSFPSPFESLIERERWHLVEGTLRRLSKTDQRFVRLYYVEGLSPEQVAVEMNISVKTVYSKKHKIRCRLERAVAEATMQSVAA